MTEALWGVVIGGVFTLLGSIGSQFIAIASRKSMQRREEVLPAAARVLRAAHQARDLAILHSIHKHEALSLENKLDSPELKDGLAKQTDLLRQVTAKTEQATRTMEHWQEQWSELLVVGEELSLLMPDIEPERERLAVATAIEDMDVGHPHGPENNDISKEYYAARTALRDKVHQLLK